MPKTIWIIGSCAVGLLAVLYVVLRSGSADTAGRAAATPVASAQSLAAGAPLRQEFSFFVAGGKRTAGPELMTVAQGTEVTLHVLADQADELHLHGYDRTLPLAAGTPVALVFVADRAGRFELELHRAHHALGVLEVQPR